MERPKSESYISEFDRRNKEYNNLEKKSEQEFFDEFDPKITELNDRIISYLSEHGLNNVEELKNFYNDHKNLEGQLFDRIKDFERKFNFKGLDLQLVESNLRSLREEKRKEKYRQNRESIESIIKQKPPTSELRAMIEKLSLEIKPWENWYKIEGLDVPKEIKDLGTEIGVFIWLVIADKVNDIRLKNGIDILEFVAEKLKEERGEYTLEDYKEAKDAAAEDYSTNDNNPHSGRAEKHAAEAKLRIIKEALQKRGVLKSTSGERITWELDKLYPNAKSKTVVQYQGNKYQIRYFPLEHSRSGNSVTGWGHEWVPTK